MKRALTVFTFVAAVVSPALAAIDGKRPAPDAPARPGQSKTAPAPKWMLQDFLRLSAGSPDRLLSLANKMFDADRLRVVSLEARYAHDWQHRLAMVQALSDIFDPGAQRSVKATAAHRAEARKVLVSAMLNDPSLLVRDGVVESIRRIMRMRPQERLVWKKPLEAAFLSKKNFDKGGGFFIRETILTALREGGLDLSPRLRTAALRDQNVRVKNLLRGWDTRAFDTL